MTKLRILRLRIVLTTILVTAVMGMIQFALPAEDAYRAVRAAVRERPADQSIVVVAVDDRTLNTLGQEKTRRDQDAQVVETLLAAGAKRVFFDFAFSNRTTKQADERFLNTLVKHRDRVFIGGAPAIDNDGRKHLELLPHSYFRDKVSIVSLHGEAAPFSLSTRFPTHSVLGDRSQRSMCAELANFKGAGGMFRPDFAINYRTIPTISYVSVLSSEAPDSVVRGKDVIIAPTNLDNNDYHQLPMGEFAPGVFFHVLAAETLKAGFPIDLGWLLPFVIACFVLALLSLRSRNIWRPACFSLTAIFLFPFLLDSTVYSVDIVPAVSCLGIGWFRLHRLYRKVHHDGTSLLHIDALKQNDSIYDSDVIALKIRNFSTIAAEASSRDIRFLLDAVIRRLSTTEKDAAFAFERDTLVWLRPKLPGPTLEAHAFGLHSLFRAGLAFRGSATVDMNVNIGIDDNHDLDTRQRIEMALQCAEDAARGGRILVVSEPVELEDREWRLQLLSKLDEAMQNNSVEIRYQPKINLADRGIIGVEALLRWTHPERGYVDPEQVVALAEAHNRIDDLTLYTLETALRDCRKFIDVDRDFTIAINISPVSLQNEPIFSRIKVLLTQYDMNPQNLILEITESKPISRQLIDQVLLGIQKLGVQVSLDDFGTGSSSLEYLRHLPSSEIKIDRSFIMDLEYSQEDRSIVKHAIEMASDLGRRVVAEGVETEGAAKLLCEMGCLAAQGYLFSAAVPATEIGKMMAGKKFAA